jgi:hypothetical protein
MNERLADSTYCTTQKDIGLKKTEKYRMNTKTLLDFK